MKEIYKKSVRLSRIEIEHARRDIVSDFKKRAYLEAVETLYDMGVIKFTPAVESISKTKTGSGHLDGTEIIWRFEYDRGVQEPEDYSSNDPLVFFDIYTGIEIRRTPFWKESEAVPKGQNCLLLSQYMQYAKQNNIEVKTRSTDK